MNKEYTVGFAFDKEDYKVVLILKEKPEWQAGCLNGVGGKMEAGETPVQTMVREFLEETGVKTNTDDWKYFGLLQGDVEETSKVHVFVSQIDTAKCSTLTKEIVTTIDPENIMNYRTVDNLPWLILAAQLYLKRSNFFITTIYKETN